MLRSSYYRAIRVLEFDIVKTLTRKDHELRFHFVLKSGSLIECVYAM